MSTHTATIRWARASQPFLDRRYSRAHRWQFDGGQDLLASSSPDVVRVPFSDPAGVDPEEAFVASLSSCHMLWFLSLAAQAGLCIDAYVDAAEGHMRKDAQGQLWMAEVVLRPQLVISGRAPAEGEVEALHHAAHEACFLARSVRSELRIEAGWAMA